MDAVMIVFVGVAIVGSLLLGLRRAGRQPDGWKVDQWGNRYYSGPRVEGDGSIDRSGSDGWPE